MSLTARIALVMGVVVLLGAIALSGLAAEDQRVLQASTIKIDQDRVNTLHKITDLHSAPFVSFCFDYGYWDELVNFVGRPSARWADQNLAGTLDTYHLAGLWVLRPDATPVWKKTREAADSLRPPIEKSTIRALLQQRNPISRFFVRMGKDVVEVCISPIVSSADPKRKGKIFGAFLTYQSWNKETILDLEKSTDTTITIEKPQGDRPLSRTSGSGVFEYNQRLVGPNGELVGYRVFRQTNELSNLLAASHDTSVVRSDVVLGGLIFVMVALTYALVGRPLWAVRKALELHSVGPLHLYSGSRSEIGQLANLIERSIIQDEDLRELNETLEKRVRLRAAELENAYDATIEGLTRALEYRDEETEGHCKRVTSMAVQMAELWGMTTGQIEQVRRGALLHDIGKLAIPDRILLKEGPLTPEEWITMRRHPTIAMQMLEPVEFLRPALVIPHYHHEKWDGTGYPAGLRGEQIPIEARMFAAVDIWDALRSDRPYRKAWPIEKVREYVASLSGSHLDPEVVELFLTLEETQLPLHVAAA